ncbi:hypothetical protein [Streptomyces sp. NPDC059994]|uniref:hypothetical protein n=1 Tax=Streptomyces sp. NPDC059994 TaxID=3347029 RepID=UPI00368C9506
MCADDVTAGKPATQADVKKRRPMSKDKHVIDPDGSASVPDRRPAPVADAAQFEELRRAATTVKIPANFDGWHPNEITQWRSDVEDDESVSDADVYRVRAAVDYALGIDPDAMYADLA